MTPMGCQSAEAIISAGLPPADARAAKTGQKKRPSATSRPPPASMCWKMARWGHDLAPCSADVTVSPAIKPRDIRPDVSGLFCFSAAQQNSAKRCLARSRTRGTARSGNQPQEDMNSSK